MKILHVVSAYYPATYWGGPIFSVHAVCNGVARHSDVSLRVLTTDSAGEAISDRLPVTNVPELYPGGYEVYMTRRLAGRDFAPKLLMNLLPLTKWADVVHLTGNYSYLTLATMTACRYVDRPLLWSPRGTLQATEQWQGVRRRRMKDCFDALVRTTMPSRAIMHMTAEMEQAPSESRIPGIPCVVIPNGIDLPMSLPERVWRPNGRLRLMFISRLDPKKGLENLLKAMADLPDYVSLDVYGTGPSEYLANLRTLANDLDISDRVIFHGHVVGETKTSAFTRADIFVLPSFSENFGMVVAEALAHGVPTITSHSTPWQEIEVVGCGRWISNEPGTLAEAIREMSNGDLAGMGRTGREWIGAEFGWQGLADRVVEVYRKLANHRPTQ